VRATDLKPRPKPSNPVARPREDRELEVPPYLRRYADERDAWIAERRGTR